MPKATKRESGNWRALAFYVDDNGKRCRKSFTAPTKREAEAMANTFMLNRKDYSRGKLTLEVATDEYIKLNENVLSPTTLYGYKKVKRSFPKNLMEKYLCDITKKDIDGWIQEQSEKHSPKTVSNRYGFLHTVMKYNGIDIKDHKLPQKRPKEYFIPTKEEVDKLISYARTIEDEELLLIVMLGAYGCMRRGEICGLTPQDVNGNVIHIHNNKVNYDGGTIIKGTKTYSSDRYIEAPKTLLDELKGRTCFVTVAPSTASKKVKDAVKECGLNPAFHLHSLRHFCASYLHANNMPTRYIQEYGGWSDTKTLEKIYRHILSDYKKMYSEKLNEIF